ncbi:MAG: threonine/serine exporter family protein [Marmoricola sp.]|nr:threonine/serine exporter family protein [Marmoricola sp.]
MDDEPAGRRLLAYLGTAMIATGAPVHEVEQEIRELGAHLGHPDVQVAAGATGITLALSSGAPATYESVNGPLRLDQGADVRLVRLQLLTDRIGADEAERILLGLRAKRSPYPGWIGSLGYVACSTGIALILQPGWPNVLFAAVGGLVVVGLLRMAGPRPSLAVLVPTAAALLVGLLVFGAADAGWLDGPLRTALPPLAVLLPGALLVTGLSELAAGHMVAGSSRLLYGTIQLVLFTLGLSAAAALLDVPGSELGNVRVPSPGWWVAPLGLVVILVGIAALEGVTVAQTPWVGAVLVATYVGQIAGQQVGLALGAFLGALAASLGATLVELVHPELPRLVVFMPSFWLLVPGSLGLIGVSQAAVGGPGSFYDVVAVVGAVAVGLMLGTTVRTFRQGGRAELSPEG